MRVLITGGAGFIGSHIVDGVLAQGFEPFVVDNLEAGRRENLPADVPLYEIDICDEERLADVFDEVRPQAVCHQAAQMSVSRSVSEPGYDARVNILGWLNVLDQSVRVGANQFIFASSGGVLYGDVAQPADEKHPVAPISPYGISKWAGEQYLEFYTKQNAIQGVALRYANVYGPRQNPHGEAGVVAIFSQKMLAGGEEPTIFGDGGHVRDYVFVADVARANLLALELEVPDQFVALNIGTGIGTDVNQLATLVRTRCQHCWSQVSKAGQVSAARHGPPRRGDLRSSLVAIHSAKDVLGWQPQYSVTEGLDTTVQWFFEQFHIAPP